MWSSSLRTAEVWQVRREGTFCQKGNSLPLQEILAAFEYYESQKHFGKVCLELTAVGEAAVAIECETEMRCQRSDGRVLLRIGIGIGCGNDDDPEPAAVLATRRQHRRTQRIALPVAQREENRHLSLYIGLEADVALDLVGPLRTPGLDCLLPVAAEIFLDCVAHQARLMRRFAFRLDAEPGLAVRRVANILHFDFACPAIHAILGRQACKNNMRFAPVHNAARS